MAARRSVKLRLIGGTTFEFRDDVPASRTDCVDGPRPCPHVKCRYHLWRVDGPDRRGRRTEGRTPGTTLRPAWVDWPTPPSCALDVAERSADMNVEQMAAAIGIRPSQFRVVVAGAIAKLRAAGISLPELAEAGG